MQKEIVHLRESSDDTQIHLDSNRQKFETDGQFLLRLMKFGKRLTRLLVVKDYGIDGRRLGELNSSGQCKKSWKLNDAGKRLYVEYYCEIPLTPTKAKSIAWATEVLEKMKGGNLSQQTLFK